MLSGNISEYLSTLKGIQQIDLSENDLTGQVPQFLGNFSSLNYINISYNNFEGPIPKGGIFGNPTAVFLQGNTGLCETAAAIFGLPICPTTPATKKEDKYTPAADNNCTDYYCFVLNYMCCCHCHEGD